MTLKVKAVRSEELGQSFFWNEMDQKLDVACGVKRMTFDTDSKTLRLEFFDGSGLSVLIPYITNVPRKREIFDNLSEHEKAVTVEPTAYPLRTNLKGEVVLYLKNSLSDPFVTVEVIPYEAKYTALNKGNFKVRLVGDSINVTHTTSKKLVRVDWLPD